MKSDRPLRVVLILALASALLLFAATAVVWATASPGFYFTDNITSTGTSPNVTVMEQALVDRIDAATTSIDLAIYDFNRDRIRDALIAAKGRGVTVRVAADDEARLHNATYKPYFDALAAAGITIVDDGRPNSIMHNKFFIFDDAVVWTGSTNMTDNGFTKNHNNSIVFTSTVLADIYSREFDQMIAGTFSVNKSANPTTTLTYEGHPLEIYFSPKDDALDEVIAEVNAADSQIVFSIFFFTADGLRDALISARNRGVAIKGVWDLLGAANSFSDDEALCAAGIPIKIETYIGKMHNKFMVIDPTGSDPTVITGSMNWTGSGDASNDENTIILHDGLTAVAYRDAFEALYDALPAETSCLPGDDTLNKLYYLPLLRNGQEVVNPPADVQLALIVYDPDGSDVDGEYVKIDNRGQGAQDLTGWTLSDAANTTFTFPTATLPAGGSVYVWVKVGTNDGTNFYWGRGSPVWNNSGDSATLKDNGGAVKDTCTYSGSGVDGFFECP